MDVFNVIWNFIRDHYHAFIELGLAICVLLVTLFKKKVKINSTFEQVLNLLPSYIVEAESKFASGQDKFGFVFNKAIELLVALTRKKREDLLDEYAPALNVAIENILSTPQKKER